jgi:hypothetical protein
MCLLRRRRFQSGNYAYPRINLVTETSELSDSSLRLQICKMIAQLILTIVLLVSVCDAFSSRRAVTDRKVTFSRLQAKSNDAFSFDAISKNINNALNAGSSPNIFESFLSNFSPKNVQPGAKTNTNNRNSKELYTEALVVGSGITGSTAAFYLKQQGIDCLLTDVKNEVGGNLITKKGKNKIEQKKNFKNRKNSVEY